MGISGQYMREIQRELGYSATWFPNVRISPGDIGIFEDHQFHSKGTLKDFGVPFSVAKGGSPSELDYSSKDSVSVQVKLAGQAPIVGSNLAQADAGVTIRFSRQNSILFRATNCKSTRLSNLISIGKKIENMYSKDRWDKNLVVITQVIKAKGSTIVISHGSDSQIDLTAKGQLTAGIINLADINAGFKIVHESNIATRFVTEPNFTPLFEAWGLKRKLFRMRFKLSKSAKKDGKKRNGKKKGQVQFVKIDYKDYRMR
jgi:hypothetical protein